MDVYRGRFLGVAFETEKKQKPDVGVLIRHVAADSDAEKAGLKAGDVLIAVAKHPLTGPALLQYALLTQRWMPSLVAGMEIDLEVRRKSGEDTEDIRIQFLAD